MTVSSTRSKRPNERTSRCRRCCSGSGSSGAKDLTAALADQLGVPFIDFLETPIHQDAPDPDHRRDRAALASRCPVDFEGHKLVVAFAEPADDDAVAAIGAATTYEIIAAVADREELLSAINMIYGAPPAAGDGAARCRAPPRSAPTSRPDDIHINDLLDARRSSGTAPTCTSPSGSPPVVRVNGDLRPIPELPVLNGSQIRQMVYSILTQKQREKFENDLELDTSYALPGKGRFRVNVFLQRDSVGCVMRAIPYDVIDFDALGVPPAVQVVGVPAPRARAHHRPDRFRQVDDARVADRHREP